MTSVNEMNAVINDRARIREGIVDAAKRHGMEVSNPDGTRVTYIPINEALVLLTDNVMKPEDEENT
jgi:hypothetical protein